MDESPPLYSGEGRRRQPSISNIVAYFIKLSSVTFSAVLLIQGLNLRFGFSAIDRVNEHGMILLRLIPIAFGPLRQRFIEHIGFAAYPAMRAGSPIRACARATIATPPWQLKEVPLSHSIGIEAFRFFICRT